MSNLVGFVLGGGGKAMTTLRGQLSAVLDVAGVVTLPQCARHCYIWHPPMPGGRRIARAHMTRETKYSPLALANTFIMRHAQEREITHMKVQKLCYYAHGWWLAFDPEPFLTERPQVWKFGPVFASLYTALAHHGSKPIPRPEKVRFDAPPPIVSDEKYLELIDWVWGRYGQYTAMTLSDMTHAPGTPWRRVAERHNFQVPKHFDLPDEDVAKFFKAEAEALEPA